jgi:hypothetical protein
MLQVIGIELLAQTLLPAVEDLATDKHWRVRQAIIEHTPMLATQVRWAYGTKETTHTASGHPALPSSLLQRLPLISTLFPAPAP